jgi:hypothetical protein
MRPAAMYTRQCRIRAVALVVGTAGAMLAYTAPEALAAKTNSATPTSPRICAGQVLSQPFLAEEDSGLFTLVPGGEFNSASEGWTLSGGASVVVASRPNETRGGVLSLPAGSKAVSPPMCVTLAYPMARAWVNAVGASKPVKVSVSYAGTPSELAPQPVGSLKAKHGAWTLGKFGVAPVLGGSELAPRQVQFVFEGGAKGTNEIYDVYVDPRMGH